MWTPYCRIGILDYSVAKIDVLQRLQHSKALDPVRYYSVAKIDVLQILQYNTALDPVQYYSVTKLGPEEVT
jgi:hypothetical protein